jgi:iron complex outermembrane recepter protein
MPAKGAIIHHRVPHPDVQHKFFIGMKKLFFSCLLPAIAVTACAQKEKKFNDTTFIAPVEITAVRASEKAPFSKTNLTKKDIEKNNLGQDLPFLLNQTPSVVVNSDAGNGVGYTGIRIRGTDASRINVTLNGIPYNDAESQGTFFVDLPDFASSVNSIQIQRGVGTSSNGAGAFGASINLSTNEINQQAYAEINTGGGSFGTRKQTIKAGTGILSNHFTVDARLSKITSDGFIDRAATDLKGFYLSGAYLSGKSSLRLNIIGGKEKTFQAWNGVPEAKLFGTKADLDAHYYNNIGSLYFTAADSANLYNANPRKFNTFLYNNQTDNYQQDHYQLFFNHAFNSKLSFNTTFFLSKGKGYYEEYKTQAKFSSYGLPNFSTGDTVIKKTDLVRQLWLDNNYYGGLFSLQYKSDKDEITAGGGFNQYDGNHFGKIIWAQTGVQKDYEWYRYKAKKKDASIYTKYQHNLSPYLSVFADLQYRHINYNFTGTRKFPGLKVDEQYNFFNPKAGLYYSKNNWSAYASYSVANKEPNKSDFETASDEKTPKAERLNDIEMGAEYNGANYNWGITFFYMQYNNQLVQTGKINDVGDAIRINVPKSYRTGIELQGKIILNKYFSLNGNFALSANKLKNFSDYTPMYDASFDFVKQDTFYASSSVLAFSPAVVSNAALQVFPFKNAAISLNGKFVSKQYLDNTTNEKRKLNGYFVQDLQLSYVIKNVLFKEINIIARVNNLFNKKYESNGYTYSYFYDASLVTENFYFPMAGRNFMIGLSLKL